MTAQLTTASADRDELLDMLDLEEIDLDIYRANLVFADPYSLYGGQVAAQALLAAGRTVPDGREPHSLHGYFLRPGDASRPTVFRVYRDRDGRSFSARRVVALQRGKVIFNMSASFHVRESGVDSQAIDLPEMPAPESCPPQVLPRLFSMEARQVPQPPGSNELPTRFWARCMAKLPGDALLDACVLTYLSDISTGLAPLSTGRATPGASLDHAVWFHRQVRMDQWILMDLVPHTVAGGRGWYTGSLSDQEGTLVANLAQEALFRTAE